jgi:hypothetical protein
VITGLPEVDDKVLRNFQKRQNSLLGKQGGVGKYTVVKYLRILRRQLKVDVLPLEPHLRPLHRMRSNRSMRKLSRNYVPAPHTNGLTRPR